MTTIPAPRRTSRSSTPGHGVADPAQGIELDQRTRVLLGLLRLSLGTVFAWAFLDKTFGLGHETTRDAAWTAGGSPTEGFLTNAVTGPFADAFSSMAGAAWADWLFMLSLAGLGTALLLGVAVRLAAVTGSLLMLLMWAAVLPPANHPFMDSHIVYALVLLVLASTRAGDVLGLGSWWGRLPLVRRVPVLR